MDFCYSEIPVQMTLANIVYHNFFERFPNIKMVSAENGFNWLPGFLEKMDKMRGMAKNGYLPCGQLKERPSKIFKRHCYVVAYPEDDVKESSRRSARRIVWSWVPTSRTRKRPEPRDFYKEALVSVAPDTARAIMYDNGRRLMPRG